MKEQIVSDYQRIFGNAPESIACAPGRVNLIGEHTDYNDGFVFPMAINRSVWIAFTPTNNDQVELYSASFDEHYSFSLNDFAKEGPEWSEYVKAVAWVLQQEGFELRGWRGVINSDVPVGSGLSSSAALELAVAHVFQHLGDFERDAKSLALLAQKAENKWVGVNCGIMDQLASSACRKNKALLIDCRSLETEEVPLPEDMAIVIMDTGTRRQLQNSAYNERRTQCETGARFFSREKLRDVSLEEFNSQADKLDEITRRRCRHVITENARTLKAREALRGGDSQAFGHLMNESHESLRHDFEVSSSALDAIVEIAREQNGCLGARMTGAGFGGCAVAAVNKEVTDSFVAAVQKAYEARTGNQSMLFASYPEEGARIVQSLSAETTQAT